MKRLPIIPEQTWLHEPTADDLKRRIATLFAWLLAGWLAAAVLLIAFLITCHLR